MKNIFPNLPKLELGWNLDRALWIGAFLVSLPFGVTKLSLVLLLMGVAILLLESTLLFLVEKSVERSKTTAACRTSHD